MQLQLKSLENLLEMVEKIYLKYDVCIEKIVSLKRIVQDLKDNTNIRNTVKKIGQLINNFNDILEEIHDVFFGHYENYKNYPVLKDFLTHREYYSQEDKIKEFQKQLKDNHYKIYLIDDLKLVNLFDKLEEISFSTKKDLDRYIENCYLEIIIKPKTDHFEEEYQNYFRYLSKHGYQYSKSDIYDPFTIATVLAHIFGGKVLTEGFIVYDKCFHYPKDFDNEEYLQKLKDFLKMHHDTLFVNNYREMSLIQQKIKEQIATLSQVYEKYYHAINQELYENISNSEIVFLQKCYVAYVPKFGYGEYTYIDYYKNIELDSFRKNMSNHSLGSWKVNSGVTTNYDPDYTICIYSNIFHWERFDEARQFNQQLIEELDSTNYVNQETLENVMRDKYIIKANASLDYDTLLMEYYSHFGMNPKNFAEMIQTKYGCDVTYPNKENQSTRIIERKTNGNKNYSHKK